MLTASNQCNFLLRLILESGEIAKSATGDSSEMPVIVAISNMPEILETE